MEKNIDELEKENLKYDVALKMANLNLKTLLNKNTNLEEKIDKALEYCNNNIEFCDRLVDIIDILHGKDKGE